MIADSYDSYESYPDPIIDDTLLSSAQYLSLHL